MILSSTLLLLALIAYGYLYSFLGRGLSKIKWSSNSRNLQFKLKNFAVLIPHKNDNEAIKLLVKSLSGLKGLEEATIFIVDDYSNASQLQGLKDLAQTYPKVFEIIVNEGNSGKKGALAHALKQIEEPLILQLDADVIPTNDLVTEIERAWQPSSNLLIAGIRMKPSPNFWSSLSALDHLSLQLTTFSSAANQSPIMASGACMFYRKESFLKYTDIGSEWQSGDDTFFAQALAINERESIVINPLAYSETAAPKNFNSFIKQRLRWGAKTPAYPSFKAKLIALKVAFMNAFLVIGSLTSLFWPGLFGFVGLFWLIKALGDYRLLKTYANHSGELALLRNYPLKAIAYPFYIALVVALIPFAPKKRWLNT